MRSQHFNIVVILKCSSLIKWLLGKYTLHDATQTIPKVLTIKIKISEYDLQKGAIHKALDITVPPPTNAAVAAPAPKVAAPVSHKKVRCSSDKKAPSLTQHWKDCLAGKCRCCEENCSTSNNAEASH